MKIISILPSLLLCLFLLLTSCKQESPAPKQHELLSITQDSASAFKLADDIKSHSAIKLAPGLQINLWATDSLAPDPVGMDIDAYNNVYLTRTNRQKNSEFDIRGYPQWMTRSIGFQSVEDRRAFLHKEFSPEKSKENSWLPDLNGDSLHDWHDLAVEKEEVWKIQDRNHDGMADISTRVIHDFNDEVTDILAGILVREHDMYLTVGPDVWHMEDTDGDGIMDKKTSISHGYSVHIGFSGHNVSGIIQGPDGKIYWNVGDIGGNITDLKGNKYPHPNEGMILRSNPDGSDFEVYAQGLRNTHEFVFDDHGNLISSDNDGDHRGESERLVHVVEGSDAGWRSNWQYGKYTDPKNNRYHVWMDEKMSIPRWDGQAAYIIPPIQNFHNGPTGMVFNPGTALGKDWLNKFFLVEFVGNPSSSHIWAFDLKPKGASFELKSDLDLVSGILPTGIRFGTDGALYAADWVIGWNTKDYGRIWKIDVAADKNDLKNERAEVEKLMKENVSVLNDDQLLSRMKHADMRIRTKAQFEAVARGDKGYTVLKKAIDQKDNQFARMHGIWGLGQLIDKNIKYADDLKTLLKDGDEEIVAQSIKMLGDHKVTDAGDAIQTKLNHSNPRINFFATQAMGRLKQTEAFDDLIKVLVNNKDSDVYIRHAAVLALARIGHSDKLTALAGNASRSARIGAVLALRRLKSPEIKAFLNDTDEYIVAETARAINDDESIPEALPSLANLVKSTRFKSEVILRRAINACLRVGDDAHLDALIEFAHRPDVSNALKAEAMATIGTWANPSETDRVDGRYRGVITRDANNVAAHIKPKLSEFVNAKDAAILISTANLIAELNLQDRAQDLVTMFKNDSADVRSSALKALDRIKFNGLSSMIITGMKDKSPKVRTAAVGLLDKADLSPEILTQTINTFIQKGSPHEQQGLMTVLGKLPLAKSEPVLNKLLDDLKNKKLSDNLILDLQETVEQSTSTALKDKLKSIQSYSNPMDEYAVALHGGNGWAGYRIFNENLTAQCIKCHTINGAGSNVGPNLSHIGSSLTRKQILQAMVDPTARLAPGYGVVTLTLKDGSEVFGKLDKETKKDLTLITANAEPLVIPLDRIARRKNIPSSMPVMTSKLSKREMRDVVEFLAGMK